MAENKPGKILNENQDESVKDTKQCTSGIHAHFKTRNGRIVIPNPMMQFNPAGSAGHGKILMESIEKMRREGSFCDVALVIGEERFLAHRLVLMAASKFFETMFEGKHSNNTIAEVELHMIPSNILRRILEFIYTGKIKFSMEDPKLFFKSLQILQLHTLMGKYADYLIEHMDRFNCNLVMDLVRKYWDIDSALKRKQAKAESTLLQKVEHFRKIWKANQDISLRCEDM